MRRHAERLASTSDTGPGFGTDPEYVAADRICGDSGCVLRYERTFMRPLLQTD
jgi:hypothetical protein